MRDLDSEGYGRDLLLIRSGYTGCACRDCMEITISSDVTRPEMCGDCEDAGCEPDSECEAPGAYGGWGWGYDDNQDQED